MSNYKLAVFPEIFLDENNEYNHIFLSNFYSCSKYQMYIDKKNQLNTYIFNGDFVQ